MEEAFLGLRTHPAARTFSEVLIVRFEARLYYANVSVLEEWIARATSDKPALREIVIDCRGINGIDATAVKELEDLISDLRVSGVVFTPAKLPVRRRIQTAGWMQRFGPGVTCPTTRDALRSYISP